jgi:hypothetical protein
VDVAEAYERGVLHGFAVRGNAYALAVRKYLGAVLRDGTDLLVDASIRQCSRCDIAHDPESCDADAYDPEHSGKREGKQHLFLLFLDC